jgi:hypothetical protein
MSAAATTPNAGSPFLWVFGAFASFAVLLAFFLNLARPGEVDPRAAERSKNTEKIVKAQTELITKMGLADTTKKGQIFEKTVELLNSRKPTASMQVVPGSPTQLKQAAASTPAPTAPATPPTPAK